jgi:hypothetical protein
MASPDGSRPSLESMADELRRLRKSNELLRARVNRLEHEVGTLRPVIREVKSLRLWDFTPYGVVPDDSWVGVDRDGAVELMRALAGADHWTPWHTRLEPRP